MIYGHNVDVSQTGCKLSAFTNVGMANVVSYTTVCLVPYAFMAQRLGPTSVDSFIRRHLGWIILGVFALEGATGMVPAIYMDLDDLGIHCNATQGIPVVRFIDITDFTAFANTCILVPGSFYSWPRHALCSHSIYSSIYHYNCTTDHFDHQVKHSTCSKKIPITCCVVGQERHWILKKCEIHFPTLSSSSGHTSLLTFPTQFSIWSFFQQCWGIEDA